MVKGMEKEENKSASKKVQTEEEKEALRKRVAAMRAKRRAATKKMRSGLKKFNEAKKENKVGEPKKIYPNPENYVSRVPESILAEMMEDDEVPINSQSPDEFPQKPPIYFGTQETYEREVKKEEKNEEKKEYNDATRGLDLEKLASLYIKKRDREIKKEDEGENLERIERVSQKWQAKFSHYIEENKLAIKAKYGREYEPLLPPYKPPSQIKKEAFEERQKYFKGLIDKHEENRKKREGPLEEEEEDSIDLGNDYKFTRETINNFINYTKTWYLKKNK